MNPILKNAIDWRPSDPQDPHGNDKKKFINYMIDNHCGFNNATSIKSLLKSIPGFATKYKKESFQHNILVPLREDPKVFIGIRSNKGIFLVTNADDANTTYKFYSTRINSEQKHWRNLRKIAKKYKLFKNYKSTDQKGHRSFVFFDESGTPSLKDSNVTPYFIVSAVILSSKSELKKLDAKFKNLRSIFKKDGSFEFKSNKLKNGELRTILNDLYSIDYEFASVCFIKKTLKGSGFGYPKSFYKYAYQMLIDRVLTYTGEANLYFDKYGDESFKNDFFAYVQESNLGFPLGKIHEMKMVNSYEEAGNQLADLISGMIYKRELKKIDLLPLIEEKMKQDIYYFFKQS